MDVGESVNRRSARIRSGSHGGGVVQNFLVTLLLNGAQGLAESGQAPRKTDPSFAAMRYNFREPPQREINNLAYLARQSPADLI